MRKWRRISKVFFTKIVKIIKIIEVAEVIKVVDVSKYRSIEVPKYRSIEVSKHKKSPHHMRTTPSVFYRTKIDSESTK